MTTCRWWNRWWHRRQREADVRWLLPAIIERAKLQQDDDVAARIEEAFALHATLPGQEHWRCECAWQEADALRHGEGPEQG